MKTYTTLEQKYNCLIVKLTDEGKEELKDLILTKNWNDFHILSELLEEHTSNGWGFATADMVGGLSEAPVLLYNCTIDGDRNFMFEIGYAFEDYMQCNLAEKLFSDGQLIFNKFYTTF